MITSRLEWNRRGRPHRKLRVGIRVPVVAAALYFSGGTAHAYVSAPALDPLFASSYTIVDLGAPLGVSPTLGGIFISSSATGQMYIGGSADTGSAVINDEFLIRDATNHITGFSGASLFSTAPGSATGSGIDAGLLVEPTTGVTFYTTNDNHIGEIKAGSTSPDKLVDLTSLGITSSTGGITIVPGGFTNAGHLKITSAGGSTVYDATLSSDGTGTFDITAVSAGTALQSNSAPTGISYVPGGSPVFTSSNILVNESAPQDIVYYKVDTAGTPDPKSRQSFITSTGANLEGSAFDPLTNDFLFSSNGHIYEVQGFAPPTPTPEPGTLAMVASGLVALVARRKKVGKMSLRRR